MSCPEYIRPLIPAPWEDTCGVYYANTPLRHENKTTNIVFEETWRQTAKLGISTAWGMSHHLPAASYVGLFANTFAREYENGFSWIMTAAAFTASLIPVWGNLVDAGYAGFEWYNNGWNEDVALRLGGAFLGLVIDVSPVARVMKIGSESAPVSSVRISMLRLAEDILDGMAKNNGTQKMLNIQKFLSTKENALTDAGTNLLGVLKKDLGELWMGLAAKDKDILEKQFFDTLVKHSGSPEEGYKQIQYQIMREVSKFKSANTQPWLTTRQIPGLRHLQPELGLYPRGIFISTHPLKPHISSGRAWKTITPSRIADLWKTEESVARGIRSFIRTEFPDTGLEGLAEYGRHGKAFLKSVSDDLQKQFNNGQIVKIGKIDVFGMNEVHHLTQAGQRRIDTLMAELNIAPDNEELKHALYIACKEQEKLMTRMQAGVKPDKTIDWGEPSMKQIDSYLDKIIKKGRFPWDLVRMRIETNTNEESRQIAAYLLKQHNGVMLINLGRVKNLDTDSPYCGIHLGLVSKDGTICEIEIMPHEMKEWFDKDHEFYKLNLPRTQEHIEAGERAFRNGERMIG